ncbi:hypothetical protein GCM10010492_70490 [Saccharothrix mutabilis subsp. mutabilis]|uniref:Alpha/beta hydrolase n=1 Tax=Saccharothrix mutabilis subsp. mutabilis TaxID=66855 RepID=A0ABP3EG70_9PSEU
MADVVGVHGVGWQYQSRDKMAELWRQEIAKGLSSARSPRKGDFTFEAAFYGGLYRRPPGHKGLDSPDRLEPGLATEFVLELAGGTPAEGTKVYLPRPAQWALRTLQATDYFANVGHVALVRFANQVGRYFTDLQLREGAQDEFVKAVGGGAKVVVAHSLGSVIAYDVLRQEPRLDVDVLITLGSPLGLRVIRERLGVLGNGRDNWPGQVRQWVNVAAEEDAIALVKVLEPLYCQGIDDRPVRNSRMRAHLATRYLNVVETSSVIADALA